MLIYEQVRYMKTKGPSVKVMYWSAENPEHGIWPNLLSIPTPDQQLDPGKDFDGKDAPHWLLGETVRFVGKVMMDKDDTPALNALHPLEHIPPEQKAKYDYYLLLVNPKGTRSKIRFFHRHAVTSFGCQNLSRGVWQNHSGT